MINWEWFTNPLTLQLFIYCLFRANFEDTTWQGISILKGSFITSYDTLHSDTKQTLQQLRTNLLRLQRTREITVKSTNKYTIITICKYEDYQSIQQTNNNQITNKQQTNNNQITTDKNIKKDKKEKNIKNNLSIEEKNFDFSSNPMLKPFSQSEINKIDLLKQDFNFDFLNNKDFFNGEIENEFLNWILYLKAFGKKLTQQMIQIQYSNLMRNSNNNKEKAINLINRSISKGWGDIYIEKIDIDFDINLILNNSTNQEYIDFINYIEKYATFLNRMKEPLTEEQFIRLVKLKGLKTLKMIVVDLHNQQVYYEKLTNTFLTINKFIERNEKK